MAGILCKSIGHLCSCQHSQILNSSGMYATEQQAAAWLEQ
jgi:hypothetical protein